MSYCTEFRTEIRPSIIVVHRVTAYYKRRQEFLSASGNIIALKTASEKGLTKHLSSMAWEGPWATGNLLSISTRNLRIIGKGILNLSRNRTIRSFAWPSAWVHVLNSKISRRSAPRHPRKMINLAAIALAVILIPPSLVTVSEKNKTYLCT